MGQRDAAIQFYTITNSGIDLKDISIVHINNQYTKNGELDIHQLFTIESEYDQVLEFLPRIPNEGRRYAYGLLTPHNKEILNSILIEIISYNMKNTLSFVSDIFKIKKRAQRLF